VDRRERLLAYTLGAVVLLSLIVGGVIIARGGLRPRVRVGGDLETAAGAKLFQRNATTGELLWEVRLGDVTHEAGTKLARVRNVECAIYTDGLEELIVNADDLLVDGEAETLTFETGVKLHSGAGSSLAYTGTADRMVYDVKADCVRLEERAEFDYGRSKFIGSEMDLWFERVPDSQTTRLARCEVTPMPPIDGRRAAVVILALTAAAASAQPGSQQQFQNATVRADRIVSSWADGKIFLEGNPEITIGDATFTAEYIECELDPDQPDRVLAAHTEGAVKIVSNKLLEPATMTRVEKRQTITLEARSAVYSADAGTATLEGGVTGVLKGPHAEGNFGAARVVAYFDAKQTVRKISAYGTPVTAVYDDQNPAKPQYCEFGAGEISYVLDGEPRIVATGAPEARVPASGDTYRADTITAYLIALDDGRRVLDRIELEGSVTWVSASDKMSAETTCGHATALLTNAVRTTGLVQARGNPKVTLKNSKSEPTAEVSCDEMDQGLGEGGKLSGRGHVLVKSLSGGAPVTVEGDSITGGKVDDVTNEFVLTGNPTGHFEGDPEKGQRTVDFTADRITMRDVAKSARMVIADNAHAKMQPRREGDEPIVFDAKHIEADQRSGLFVATGRPKMTQGETTVEADRIEASSKTDEATKAKSTFGSAIGNVVVRGKTVRKPKKEGDKESTWNLVATAARADLTPEVAVPEGLSRLTSETTASRYRLTGKPEITMTEEGTGRTSTFRNVGIIDIYPLPGRNVIIDTQGADGPAELHVEQPTGGDAKP
jgi:lipopolysaccharide export system protein LptA